MNLHISAVLAIYIQQLVCMTENPCDLYHQIDFGSWEIREQIMFIQTISTQRSREGPTIQPPGRAAPSVLNQIELIPGKY